MKFEETMNIIKYYNSRRLKTQELIKLGFTNYNIQKLTKKGYLKKIKLGLYQVNLESGRSNKKLFFKEVVTVIFNGNIENAINNFFTYIESKQFHTEDYYESIICLILKELTSDEIQLNKLEKINESLTYNEKKFFILKVIKEKIMHHEFNECLNVITKIGHEGNDSPIYRILYKLVTIVLKNKSQNFNEKKLYELIKNEDYNLAYDLLQIETNKKGTKNKVYLNTVKLLKQRMAIKENTFNKPTHTTCSNLFDEFFVALKNRDYRYANILVDKILKKRRNMTEFAIYKLLLEDINALLDEKEKNPNFYALSKLLLEINKIFVGYQQLNTEKCLLLKELCEKRLSIEYNDFDLYCLNIIEIILLISKRNVTFDDFNSNYEQKRRYFEKSLQYGDYPSAIRIIEKEKNIVYLQKDYTKKQISILQTLLQTLKNELNKSKREEVNRIETIKLDEESLANFIIIDKYESELTRERVL